MDIGIWMAAATLEHKLEAREEKNPEQTWNMSRWPTRLSQDGENRLFVASGGYWRGYFKLSDEVLYNPLDRVKYTLIFDTRTWTEIPRTPVRRFRGFTYKVPSV
jgi:hypothetical protein